jgi:DNA-directed RNA polymerase specialized sigma subunit
MHHDQVDNHFTKFARSLEGVIERYGDLSEEPLPARQKREIDALVRLENEFRETLIKDPKGPEVYRNFVTYICDERRNILAARPFFRERQTVFTEFISQAFKDRADKGLYRFRINYEFVKFVLKRFEWRKNSKLVRLAHQIAKIRVEIVELNLPLAISRARIFWSRTPHSQLSYMDLIQIACLGLMAAVDKFVPPYTKAFVSTILGRITGNFIAQYSVTMVHFYPNEKRKLYRGNKIIHRYSGDGIDFEAMANKINTTSKPHQRTNASEISSIMSAASHVSADSLGPMTSLTSEHETTTADRFVAPESDRPDVLCENSEMAVKLRQAVALLPLLERKVLILKGLTN